MKKKKYIDKANSFNKYNEKCYKNSLIYQNLSYLQTLRRRNLLFFSFLASLFLLSV